MFPSLFQLFKIFDWDFADSGHKLQKLFYNKAKIDYSNVFLFFFLYEISNLMLGMIINEWFCCLHKTKPTKRASFVVAFYHLPFSCKLGFRG